jgi:hypothetical protein
MNSTLQSLILRQLAGVKNTTVAQAIGHDDGHVSRIASGERGLRISELEAFMKSLGLRVVLCDGEMVTMPKAEHEALKTLARKGLDV